MVMNLLVFKRRRNKMVEEKTPKISMEKLEDAKSFVSEDLYKILLLLNKHHLIAPEKLKKTFENKKDLNSFFENLIIDYLNDKYSEIYNRLSDVRKKGHDLTELGLKLSQFKFKLKLFKFIIVCPVPDVSATSVTSLINFKLYSPAAIAALTVA